MTLSRLRFVAFLIALAGCESTKPPDRAADPPPPAAQQLSDQAELTADVIKEHNRGVALMGKFDYAAAHDVFEKLAQEQPNWVDAQVDLAIAKLNRRMPTDVEDAQSLLDGAIKSDERNLRAKYCRGLMNLYAAEPQAAGELFQAVAEGDPADAYAVYYAGQCLFEAGDFEAALTRFELSQRLDPYLRSAYYGAFQALQRLKRMDEAQEKLRQFQKLQDNPQARLAEMKYSRMGPKGAVQTYRPPTLAPIADAKGQLFEEQAALPLAATGAAWTAFDALEKSPGITICDINGDGTTDLFVAGGLGDKNAVVLRGGQEDTVVTGHPLAGVTDVNAALWGDYDNDGLVDVYFCRSGPNQLWRQTEADKWQDVSQDAKVAGGDFNTRDGAIFDADHDGDLDIFVINQDGPNELFSNNLDGTFRPLAKDRGIAGNSSSHGIVIGDFDGDRDADLFVMNEQPPHEFYINDRLWNYRPGTGCDLLCQANITAAVAADTDADGKTEIITSSGNGIRRWSPDAEGTWQPTAIAGGISGAVSQLAVQDIDGNGELDIVAADDTSWSVCNLASDEPAFVADWADAPSRMALLAMPDNGYAIVASVSGQSPVIWPPGEGRYPIALVQFTGKENKADQMRSNRSGIGIRAAARIGPRWTALQTFRDQSGPGQSRQPAVVGLGTASSADFVSLLWPDGLFQTELELTSGELRTIEETQRQVSSCPVLFVWNGKDYQFVTDLLGVGGQGFNLADGDYAQPRPWENLLLPANLLTERDGTFALKIGEPMEESCYLDAARLVAYDLPAGWQMVIDDRQGTSEPVPTGRALFYRNEHSPVAALDAEGQDMTHRISSVDGIPALPGKLDRRFIGRTEQGHSVTLIFDQPLDQLHNGNDLVLVIDGWIEYPYSQTMFAAWQAGAAYEAPRLEVRTSSDAEWQTIYDGFGYPAGMPRRMSLPLLSDRLPEGATELRISTNMEIYWDRFSLAVIEACPEVKRHEFPMASAVVQEVGFPKRTSSPERKPHFDYERRAPLWDTRHQAGFYTSFGQALPLIADVDDAVAIIGPGEEVHLEFKAAAPFLAEGWSRRFVLESHGWCKDMDLYTEHGESLQPLPTRERPGENQSSLRREHLHQEFNRRYRAG